jgi:selenocysteine lyase/cysteine desulfurase
MFDTTYGSVKTMAKERCESVGAVLDIAPLPLPLPTNRAEAEAAIAKVVAEGVSEQTTLVVFDHTTSNTALNLPLAQLTKVARANGGPRTKILVDGAHGLLAQDVRVAQTPFDFGFPCVCSGTTLPTSTVLLADFHLLLVAQLRV